EPITGQALMSRWRQGLHDGLRGGADTSRLLNDVVALARDTQGTTETVAAFVKTWGPLWLCRTPAHHAYGRRCYWQPGQHIFWGGRARPCSWRPVEEGSAFVREARQAVTVLQIAGKLRNNTLIDQAIWTRMGIRPPAPALPDQRRALMSALHARLVVHGDLHMSTTWFSNLTEPVLALTSKVGFIHAV